MNWNEWGFRPSLCRYRLNWAKITSWGWWDEWDDAAFQPQDSKFEPWRSEFKQTTSRSQRHPTILNLYEWVGMKHFVSLKLDGQSGIRTRNLRLSKQAVLTTAPGPLPSMVVSVTLQMKCSERRLPLNECLNLCMWVYCFHHGYVRDADIVGYFACRETLSGSWAPQPVVKQLYYKPSWDRSVIHHYINHTTFIVWCILIHQIHYPSTSIS